MSDGISPVQFTQGGLSEVSATTTDSAAARPLGQRVQQGGNEYVYCHVVGTQISQGEMGFIGAASMTSQYSVTVTNAASQAGGIFAVGVANNGTIAAGDYGYLLCRGLTLIALDGDEVSMNSGVDIGAGVDGGFVAAAATLSTGLRLGFTVNSAVTTVGTSKAWFKSPIFG